MYGVSFPPEETPSLVVRCFELSQGFPNTWLSIFFPIIEVQIVYK
jgi:hypothetical protein